MRRFIVPIFVLVSGLAFSYWTFTRFNAAEHDRAVAEFERRADNISSVLTNGIKGYSSAMETLKNITSLNLQFVSNFADEQPMDFPEIKESWDERKIYFNQMAKDAGASYPGIRGLGWVAPISYDEVNDLEGFAKFLVTPDYQVREFTSDGGLGPVTERDVHFPVFYVEPMEENKIALGLDLASAGVSRNAIIEARDSGSTISTVPSNWIKTQTGQLGFLVFDPVYLPGQPIDTVEEKRESLFAVSFSIILIDDMLNNSLRGLDEEGVEFFVFSDNDTEAIELGKVAPVYSSNHRPDTFGVLHQDSVASGIVWNSPVNVLGRDWVFYGYPHEKFLESYRTSGPLLVLFLGAFITFALSGYLFQSAGDTLRITELVDKRTAQLTASYKNLEQETASRISSDEHRKELQFQLTQTQKMDSIGQLAGGVAHDFNNLLVAILGYGEMAMDKVPHGSPAYEDIEQITEAGERAKTLVRQLLAFSRQQVLELTDMNLDEVIAELIKLIQRIIGEHISLDFKSHLDLKMIRADRGQIEQILMNLCVNARDAMGDGGILTIETSNVELDQEFCSLNEWATPGNYVQLSVTDNGCGMDEDTQERIFEPFFTTKDPEAGTGLGLSTVFGIVRQHEGMVDVSSEVEKGTVIKVYLPSIDSPIQEDVKAKPEMAKGGSETILLADDDEAVLGVTKAMLENAGYTVLLARDGEEALRVFNADHTRIDLAVLDVVMPKLGGKAVVDQIHENNPEFPVLFSSGYSRDAIHTNFVLDAGMHLMQKPFNRNDLLHKIRDLL